MNSNMPREWLEKRIIELQKELQGMSKLFEEERAGRIQYQKQCANILSVVNPQAQQLAEARAQIELLQERDTEWANSQAKAVTLYAEARALLEEVGNDQEVGVADGDCDTICFYCGGDEDGWIEDGPPPYIRTYNHTPDCTWVKIRAFLQKNGG